MTSRGAFRLRAFAAKLRGFFHGHNRDDELDDEIREHLRLLGERFVAQGLSIEEAAAAARRQFGNTTLLKEDRRELGTFRSIEALWHDLRYALRVLWKDRGFAAVSIGTLGLGIGAATAIFSVIYNVMMSPFPYRDADRIVFPRIYDPQNGPRSGGRATRPPRFWNSSRTITSSTRPRPHSAKWCCTSSKRVPSRSAARS